MDRYKKAGAQGRQPAQEVQLYQELNNSISLQAALACARRGWRDANVCTAKPFEGLGFSDLPIGRIHLCEGVRHEQ